MSEGSKGRMMGIIGCRLFEDELVYLLLNDEELDHLFLVQNEEIKGLIEKIENAGHRFDVQLVTEEDLLSLHVPDEFSICLWIKPMALHQKPEKLNEDVTASIKKLEEKCRVVLLFYGLCGNAFKKIETLSKEFSVPIEILKDARGEVVDDCIGTVLGGTVEYYEQLKRSAGTFFLTPMWAENWRDLFHKVQILPDSSDIEGAKYIFKCVGYKRVLKLDTGLGDPEKFERNMEEFATLFEFKRGAIDCTLQVVEGSYARAKMLL